MTRPRALLLNPPGSRSYQRDTFCCSVSKGGYALPPGDLILLSGALDGEYRLTAMDALAEKISMEGVLRHLRTHRYDLLVVQTSSVSWPEDRQVLQRLARSGLCERLIVNGDFPLLHPEEVLGDPGLGVSAIVLNMATGELREAAPQAGDATGRRNVGPGARRIRPRHDLFPTRRYSVPWGLEKPATTVYSSLGCPMRCPFCVAGVVPFTTRPVDEVMEELTALQRQGIREVVFFDPLFNGSREHALELCTLIHREKLNLSWSCFSRVDFLEPNTMRALKEAGCHTVLLGLESGVDRVLALMEKRQTTAQVREAVAGLRRQGLRAGGFFLMGYPGERDDEIRATIRFACELDLVFASFQCLVPFAGTPLGAQLLPDLPQASDLTGYNDYDNPYPFERGRTLRQLYALRDEAYRTFYRRPSYVLGRLLGIESRTELVTLVREGGRMLLDRS